MPVSQSKESDPDRAREIALGACILRSVVGSLVHGLSNPGTDDRDEMGVCVEPPEYLLGFRRFEHFVYRTQPEGRPSGPGDLDLVVYGLRKYCHLALKGSPTVLLPLFVSDEHVVARTELGRELQALAPAFVSRAAGRAFLGYLDAQRRGLTGERHATRTRASSPASPATTRSTRCTRCGSPTRARSCSSTGGSGCRSPSRRAASLREVRVGGVPLDEVLDRLDDAASALEQA